MNNSMKKVALALSLLGVGVWPAVRAITPAAAQSDTLLYLVQDFEAFDQRCPGPPSSYSTSCANDLAGLRGREQNLQVSDADLAKAVLAHDFSEFGRHCSPSSNSSSCADQLVALRRRQQELHVSDDDMRELQAKMGIRGGLRAGRWE